MYKTTDAIRIAKKVDYDIDEHSIEEFLSGLNNESDHFEGDCSIKEYVTDPDMVLGLIVKQHLEEDEEYYIHLDMLEDAMEEEDNDEVETEDEEK